MWIRASAVCLHSSAVVRTTKTTAVSNGPRIITPAARAALLSLQSLNRRRLLFHRSGFGDPVNLTTTNNGFANHDAARNNTSNTTNGNTKNSNTNVKSLVPHRHLARRAKLSSSSSSSTKSTQNSPDHNSSSSSSSSSSSTTWTDNGYASDLVVVLDMDECLLHSQFLGGEEQDQYRQYEEERSSHIHNMESECVLPSSNGCESFRVALDSHELEYVNVNCRPHLHQFLSQVTKRYETHVFTAAMEVYARPVLQHIDPDGSYFGQRIHYRDSCILDEEWGVYVKNLSHILPNLNPARTVLVDNNPFSFLSHPSNGILVSNFYNDPKDDTLQAVYELLQHLEDAPDVRPILDKRFLLADTLQQVLSPHAAHDHNHDHDHHTLDDQNATTGPTW